MNVAVIDPQDLQKLVRAAVREALDERKAAEPAEEKLLTAEEACHRLAVGRTTLYEMRRRGDLQAVHVGKTGRAVRFRESDIEALINAQTPRWS